ncbi:hypothetical protein NDU88_004262 [Pleurodeles waltl]|uniref:Uncharacterized protein n=1 Tax=Pleurodeles waltl TaxID=8319 RepID=A0AAV7UFL2_PLEWA|nr:hypothetical protein NDU88_004262 [Pleurodeles waltl]
MCSYYDYESGQARGARQLLTPQEEARRDSRTGGKKPLQQGHPGGTESKQKRGQAADSGSAHTGPAHTAQPQGPRSRCLRRGSPAQPRWLVPPQAEARWIEAHRGQRTPAHRCIRPSSFNTGAYETSRSLCGPSPQGARLECPWQGGPVPPSNAARGDPTRVPGRPHPAASGSYLPHTERGEVPQAQVSAAVLLRGRRSRIPQGNIRVSRTSGASPYQRGVSTGRKREREVPQGTGLLLHLVGREQSS